MNEAMTELDEDYPLVILLPSPLFAMGVAIMHATVDGGSHSTERRGGEHHYHDRECTTSTNVHKRTELDVLRIVKISFSTSFKRSKSGTNEREGGTTRKERTRRGVSHDGRRRSRIEPAPKSPHRNEDASADHPYPGLNLDD